MSASSGYQKVRISRRGGNKPKPLVRRYPMKRSRGMRGPSYSVPLPRFGEVKGMDTDLTLNPIINSTNTNGSSFVLNLIQQGAGSWNRVGRKTHINSIRIKGAFNWITVPTFATGSTLTNLVRMTVVWDKQPSGAAVPTFDAVFGITAQDGTESCPDITNPPRYDNMDRFVVLREKTIHQPTTPIPSFGTGPSTTVICELDEYIKVPRLESVYSGNSSPMTIADISTGAVYVYFRAFYNTAGTVIVFFDGIARLRYTD